MVKATGAHKQIEDIDGVDFASLLDEFENKNNIDNLSVINGVIVDIRDDEVYVDIQDKSEGVLNALEIANAEGELLFKVGDTIKVSVIGSRNGRKNLSYKKALRKEKVLEFIGNYNPDTDETFEVRVVAKNRGGLVCVDKSEVEYFLPRSQCMGRDTSSLMGKTIKVKILKIDQENQSIVVSMKRVSEDEKKRRKEIIENVLSGDPIKEGVVRKITSYGMFVDIGGIDGLVHYSEISYKGPINPSSVYKEGDAVTVKVINYDEEKKHISLSIKAAAQDPWEEIKDALEVGDVLKVTVSNIENYGAFVDLGNDIEGFLHISEISWDKNIKNPKDYLHVGDEIDVDVIEIDATKRRLRVSLKNLLPKPFDEFKSKHKVGDIVNGQISSLTNFGAFVKIGNVEGLLHNEDVAWGKTVSCKDTFKVGEFIDVKIRKIDFESQKISLSVKHLSENPSETFAKSRAIGDIVTGIVSDIKDFGVFVKVADGVEALIRNEDLGDKSLSCGDSVEGVLVSTRDGKLRLSIKQVGAIETRKELDKINSDSKMTIGDIIKDQLKQ